MRKQENLQENTPEQTPEFVHIPKSVHKESIIQLFGYATVYCRLQNFVGAELMTGSFNTPMSTALELMGCGAYQMNDVFVDNVYSIITYYSEKSQSDLVSANTELLGKKIYKAVQLEVSKYDRKRFDHE